MIPTIRDRQAPRRDRIRAIRGWGNAGYVLGSDALIDLLREPGDLPKAEIVWALSMVSGMAFGDEPERWLAWWDDLPASATSPGCDESEAGLVLSHSDLS